MTKKKLPKTPHIDALIYDILYRLPKKEARELPRKYYNATANTRLAKMFCATASLEDKLEFFCHVGIKWGLFVGNESRVNPEWLQNVFAKYNNKKPHEVLDTMTRDQVCVTGSKQFMYLIGLMADTCDLSQYILNFAYNKIGYSVKRWKKSLKQVGHEELMETRDGYNIALDYAYAVTVTNHETIFQFSIDEKTMKILILLARKKNIYIHRQWLRELYENDMSTRNFTLSLKKLIALNYVEKHPDFRNKSIIITTTGVSIASNYMKRFVYNLNNLQ